MESYFLHVTSSSTEQITIGPFTDLQVNISASLLENHEYTYVVQAVNNINESARTSEKVFRKSSESFLERSYSKYCQFPYYCL